MTIQQLYDKLCSPEFQDTDNGSLAYNFYIYQYPADKEYEMRDNIVDFCDKLARPAVFVDVLALNLFKEFCSFMEKTPLGDGNVLSDSLDSEGEYPEDIAKELNVHKSVISKHISGERPYPPFEKYINQMFLQC